MKPLRGCSGITRHACTQPWATSAPSSLNSSGIERRKQSQPDQAATANTGYGKAGKQSALCNFPTATTTTNYNQYGIRDSEGKVKETPTKAAEKEYLCNHLSRCYGLNRFLTLLILKYAQVRWPNYSRDGLMQCLLCCRREPHLCESGPDLPWPGA
jgi:hypothetical protein